MKRRFMKQAVMAVLAGMTAWTIGTGPARAEPNWTNFNTSQFPSRVKSMTWPDGFVINHQEGICWGKWCVNMGSSLPTATYATTVGESGAFIRVEGLTCKNPVAGTRVCRIYLNGIQNECQVQINPGPSDPGKTLWIKCPNITLE